MITICNLRRETPKYAYDVIVDRRNVVGNPYRMFSEAERDMVCDEYEVYFNYKVEHKDPAFMNELRRLYKLHRKYGQLRLFCWCAPKRCHAETIKAFLDKYI